MVQFQGQAPSDRWSCGGICEWDKFWYVDGKLHRTNGPALEWGGRKEWWVDGKHHRTDGPAVEYANGDKFWWIDGKCHRTDGPAVEWADGDKFWWINGVQYTEEEFLRKQSPTTTTTTTAISVNLQELKNVLTPNVYGVESWDDLLDECEEVFVKANTSFLGLNILKHMAHKSKEFLQKVDS